VTHQSGSVLARIMANRVTTHGTLGRRRRIPLLKPQVENTSATPLLWKEDTSFDQKVNVSVYGSRRELMDSTGEFEGAKVVID